MGPLLDPVSGAYPAQSRPLQAGQTGPRLHRQGGFASVDALIGLTILAAGVALSLQALSQAQRLTNQAEMMAQARLLLAADEAGGFQARATETLTPFVDRPGLCKRRRVVRRLGGREHALIETLRCADAGSTP